MKATLYLSIWHFGKFYNFACSSISFTKYKTTHRKTTGPIWVETNPFKFRVKLSQTPTLYSGLKSKANRGSSFGERTVIVVSQFSFPKRRLRDIPQKSDSLRFWLLICTLTVLKNAIIFLTLMLNLFENVPPNEVLILIFICFSSWLTKCHKRMGVSCVCSYIFAWRRGPIAVHETLSVFSSLVTEVKMPAISLIFGLNCMYR